MKASFDKEEIIDEKAGEETVPEETSVDEENKSDDEIIEETVSQETVADTEEVFEEKIAEETIPEETPAGTEEITEEKIAGETISEETSADTEEVTEEKAAEETVSEEASVDTEEVTEEKIAEETVSEEASANTDKSIEEKDAEDIADTDETSKEENANTVNEDTVEVGAENESAENSNTSNEELKNEYKSVAQTIITAERLLEMVQTKDKFAIEFARKLGLGQTESEIQSNLKPLVEEYHSEIAKGNNYEEPRFVINGVDIVINKTVEELSLVRNEDGTYSASLNGTQTGYRTSVMIDADASVTIIYDEKGEAKIERKVASGKPTDFVITLDISGSMEDFGRDNAMFSALKVVLDEILSVKENTVSIVFWATNGAVMQIYVDDKGISQVFSGEEGFTAKKVFDAALVNEYGDIQDYSLSEATISRLEGLYKTAGGTQPDQGLAKALSLLKNLETNDGRKIGVMLFTDGDAYSVYNEHSTVNYEKEIAEQYGATIVNVSIGDEYDVKNFERYLDPNSTKYYEKDDEILKDHVLYYNIPKLTNQELADRVSEMFEVAFENITTEKKELQTETITNGILAAYGAQLIETIPSGFELVEVKGEENNVAYVINGIDAEGNTKISFNLGDIISGKDQVVSYCVIPTSAENDIGITAYVDQAETVLHAEPVNRVDVPEEDKNVTITVTKINSDETDRSELDEDLANPDHQHIFTVRTPLKNIYTAYDNEYHYVSSYTEQLSCIICGAKGDIITRNISRDMHGMLEKHNRVNGVCTLCGDSNRDQYYRNLLLHHKNKENPMDDPSIVDFLKQYYEQKIMDISDGKTKKQDQINTILDVLKNAPREYQELYLFSLFNYNLIGNYTFIEDNQIKSTCFFMGPNKKDDGNTLYMNKLCTKKKYSDTFFHESGHAIELTLTDPNAKTWEDFFKFPQLELKIQECLKNDVRQKILDYLREVDNSLTENERNIIANAFINGDTTQKGTYRWGLISLEKEFHPSVLGNEKLRQAYINVKKKLAGDINKIDFSNASMVADIYGGVTDNKIGVYGHTDEGYWYSNGTETYAQLREAWAEFFSAKIRNDKTNIEKNQEYFGTATVELENLAQQLLGYYISYYSDEYYIATY